MHDNNWGVFNTGSFLKFVIDLNESKYSLLLFSLFLSLDLSSQESDGSADKYGKQLPRHDSGDVKILLSA